MGIFWSASAGGFLDEELMGPVEEEAVGGMRRRNPLIPADAIEVSAEQHAELLRAQNEGKAIASDETGAPAAVDRQASAEDALAALRARRTRALTASDWSQLPDALSAAKRKPWTAYRALLRDLPDQASTILAEGGDLSTLAFPEPPSA